VTYEELQKDIQKEGFTVESVGRILTEQMEKTETREPRTLSDWGMGVASLTFGVCGVTFIFLWPAVAIPCAIVGLALGIIGRKKLPADSAPLGLATAGIVLSSVVLIITIIVLSMIFLLFYVML